MKTITCHFKLTNGRLISPKNLEKIVARSVKPTDPWGNSLPSPIAKFRNTPPYYQTFRVKKERAGYIFREVGDNSGLCGHQKKLRNLVVKTLMLGFPVTVEDR